MATSTLKSQSITQLDTVPKVPVPVGQGAPGDLQSIDDYVVALTGDAPGSTYKLVRFPTNAKVKGVTVFSTVASAGAGDFNIAFSDSTTDGTPLSVQGTIPQISSANNKLFGAAETLVGDSYTQLLFANQTNFPIGSQNFPLYEALGFTSDPGGFFDLQINVTTSIGAGGTIWAKVDFVV